jgi:hypothetical protein
MGGRDRRQRRRDERRGRAGKDYATVDIGGGMVSAAPGAILEALSQIPPAMDWPSLAGRIVPVLPRRRPESFPVGVPVQVMLPPGIQTGFGVDIGPAFLRVDGTMLESWGVDRLTLVGTSLENLRARMQSVRPRDLFEDRIDGVRVRMLQSGTGCASALLLVEDELRRILGPGPQVVIAPMRDLLVALPVDAEAEFVAWLNDELASMDPNGLALEAFILGEGPLRYRRLQESLAGS